MKQIRFLFILILVIAVAACRQDEEPEEIGSGGGTFAPVLSQPQPVTLDQLASTPQAYLDEYIQITGRYERVRALVCINETARTSPATWSISDGSLVAQVGGFDQQVNELLPAGIEVTVNGIWRFWEGRVGCGKQVETTQVWYLEATTMVSPSPLVRLTLTPSGEITLADEGTPVTEPEEEPTELTTPTATGEATETPTPVSPPDTTPSTTPLPPPTPLTPSPTSGATVTATVPITPAGSPSASPANGSPLPAGSPSGTPTGDETMTPTPTPTTPNGDSPSPTVTPGGPTATATPNADNIIVHGNVNSQSLVVDMLTAGVGHQFSFQVNAGEVISISLVMTGNNNPMFRVVEPDGDIVAQQNVNPAGQAEHLISFMISESGQHAIVLHEASGNPADYAMTLGKDSDNFVLVFNDPLTYGQTGSAFIKDSHLHFWHFFGEAGDEVTIQVDPTEVADMAFRVRNPELQFLDEDYTNGGIGGETEQATFTLPATGLYTIDVEEWDFASGNYQITITVE